ISDPAEEIFPYSGLTEFTDPESGAKLVSGRAEHIREANRCATGSRPRNRDGIARNSRRCRACGDHDSRRSPCWRCA
ncbi:hypothetical protein AB9E13_35830, partial [Rhizobium leguminosarum]